VTKKIKRQLQTILAELQTAMKREATNIITIGDLLLEVQAQVEHGSWLPWLAENFGKSVSTAENCMNAARLAAKFPMVGNLKLRPSALYLLGGELNSKAISTKAIRTVLAAAETEWISAERAREIAHPKPPPPTVAEIEAEWEKNAGEIEAEEAEEQAEVDSILDGRPPELPAAPEVTVHDPILPPFDQAIKTLLFLRTKPLDSFADTAHSPDDIRAISDFLHSVADTIQQKQKSKTAA
jgi:hypothetical protein